MYYLKILTLIAIVVLFLIRLGTPEITDGTHLLNNLSLFEKSLYSSTIVLLYLVFHKNLKNRPHSMTFPYHHFVFAVILGVGIFAASHRLDLSLTHDESFQVQSIRGLVQTGTPSYPTGISYRRDLTLAYPAALLALLNNGNVTEISARSISIIYYIATALILWKISLVIFSPTFALIASLIYCWSIASLMMARFARGYTALEFYSLLAISALYFIFHKDKPHWHILFWLACLGAPLSHTLGVWTWLLIPLYILRSQSLKKIGITLAAMGAIAVLIFLFSSSGYGTLTGGILYSVNNFRTFPQLYFPAYFPLIFPFFSLMAVLGGIYNVRHRLLYHPATYLYIVFVFIILSLSMLQIKMEQRYIVWLMPFFSLLAAYGIHVFLQIFSEIFPLKTKLVNVLVVISIAVFLIPDLSYAYQLNYGKPIPRYKSFSSHTYHYPDFKTTGTFLTTHASIEDSVISFADNSVQHYFYITDYLDYFYLPPGHELPPINRTPVEFIRNSTQLQDLINQNYRNQTSTWIITVIHADSSARDYLHYSVIDDQATQFLKANQDKVVYTSTDGGSKVYLFRQP